MPATPEPLAGVLYKPVGLAFGIVGGVVAGAVFNRLWQAVAHEPEAPEPLDEQRGWLEVAVAAAAHGAVYGSVKALVERSGAAAFARVTGVWPGEKR